MNWNLPDEVNAALAGCAVYTIRAKRLAAGVKRKRGRKPGQKDSKPRARRLRCSKQYVVQARRLAGIDLVRKLTDEEWRALDWTKQDAALAREIGVSRERVRQVRLELGKPKAKRHRARLSTPVRDAILAKLKSADGLTMREVAAATGSTLPYVYQVGRMIGYQFRNDRGTMPWHLMNWDLPNTTLQQVWGLAPPPSQRDGFAPAQARHRLGYPKAKWDMRYRQRVESDPAYQAAVREERRTAAEWKRSTNQ